MMMPANYSAVAENEMTYVVGGAFDVAAGAAKLWSNAVTIVGNTFVSKLVSSTLGVLFGGNYAVGAVFNKLGSTVTGAGTYNALNTALQVVGLTAATYQLATATVPNTTSDKVLTIS